MVTHDVNPIIGHAQKLIYIARQGVVSGTPGEILTGPVLSRIYGSPVEVHHTAGGRILVVDDHPLIVQALSQLLEAESARAHLRQELQHTEAPAERRRILQQLGQHITTQLELVQGRLAELNELAVELTDKQQLVAQRIREIDEQ